MKQKKIKIIAVFMLFLTVFMFSACSEEEKIDDINIDITETVKNLDPQFALGNMERNIILNINEGLMRYSHSGELELGLAESYSISPDKLTITFKLRDNLMWSNGDALTSDDFKFMFERMFDLSHSSPFVSSLMPIENASEVLSGEKEFSELGVKFPDKKTIEIKLREPKESFLEVFAESFMSPCNKSFFKSTYGKYGVEKKFTLCNGAFTLSRWDERQLTLTRNQAYYDELSTKNSNVNIYINREAKKKQTDSNLVNLLLEDKTDILSITEEYRSLVPSDKYTLTKRSNRTWYIGFNLNSRYFKNEDIRTAFGFDKSRMGEYNADVFDITDKIIPPSAQDGYRGVVFSTPSEEEMNKAYRRALSELNIDMLSGVKCYYLADSGLDEVMTEYIRQKNKLYGTFISPKPLETEEFFDTLKSGNFNIIMFSLTAEGFEPTDFLKQFTSDSVNNFCGVNSEELDALILKASETDDKLERNELLKMAEEELLSIGAVQPIFNTSEYILINNRIQNFAFAEDRLILRDAKKVR